MLSLFRHQNHALLVITLRLLEQDRAWQPMCRDVSGITPVVVSAHDKQQLRRQCYAQVRIVSHRIVARTLRRACTRAQ